MILNFLPAAKIAAGSFKKRSPRPFDVIFPWGHSFSNEEFLREKIERIKDQGYLSHIVGMTFLPKRPVERRPYNGE